MVHRGVVVPAIYTIITNSGCLFLTPFGYNTRSWQTFTETLLSSLPKNILHFRHCKEDQTCAKVPKRFEILGSLIPRSGTLMDLGPCTSFLPWDSGNPGHQNCVMPQDPGNPGPQKFDSRKTLETQDLKIWICGETLETQDPEPQNFDVSRLKRLWSLHHSIQNFMLSIVPRRSTGDELGRSDSKNLNSKK